MPFQSLEHAGYYGSVSWKENSHSYIGYVQNIEYSIGYSGKTLEELEQNFVSKVDHYIENGSLARL